MRKSGLLTLVLLLIALTLAAGLRPEANAGAWGQSSIGNRLSDQWSDLIVQIKKKKNKHDGTTQGERACPPGYVVLDKPNKYGAYCEPKEGLPKTPAEQEAEKCKFGMIGTPPNDCRCPDGTEFLGYKGCVKYTLQQYCNDFDKNGLTPFADKCKSQYYGTPSCATFSTEGLGSYRCCCYYRLYAN